ncbi:lipocalin-like domain-containing protein [Alcaligenes faecalis]|uniref:lipocalin-like domain-containing protein n=1 Tax=Alcaligenes faecalis TaxID=511 RepID=UPI001C82EFB4|nr:lipocalin-like domain-containing protein [Alcaligenes faecalis]
MAHTLRNKLIGVWQLESFEFVPEDGSPSYPGLGPNPIGQLIYTETGYVGAQLCSSSRTAQDSSQSLLDTYLAYAGTFEVDEAAQCVTHFVDMSLNPDWVGVPQPRLARFTQGALELITRDPVVVAGKLGVGTLLWHRAGPV